MPSKDLVVSPLEWKDLYDEWDLTPGSEVIVQNKGGDNVIAYFGPTEPSTSSFVGSVIPNDYSTWTVSGEPGLWVRTDTHYSMLTLVEAN